MDIKDYQSRLLTFLSERQWLEFSPAEVFTHLMEELGEIGRHILFITGYKAEDMRHKAPNKEDLAKEFAQAFSLFVHLAILLNVNLNNAIEEDLDSIEDRFPK